METHALHSPSSGRPALTRSLVVGFIAGALAVVVFHQSALAVLHALNVTRAAAYSFAPTAPFGIAQLWSLAFWGGVWGIVLAALLGRLEGGRLIIAATLFGAIAPTLVAWFVVAPLKGQAIAAGWAPAGMATGLIVNAAWGLGTGIGLYLFGRSYSTGLERT
jgi:hypothetical protein